MNKARRNNIAKAVTALTTLKESLEGINNTVAEPTPPTDTVGQLKHAHKLFEDARDEEQEYLDNMPEAMQNADKGDTAQADIDYLDNAATYVKEAIDMCDEKEIVEELIAKIDEAIEEVGNVS